MGRTELLEDLKRATDELLNAGGGGAVDAAYRARMHRALDHVLDTLAERRASKRARAKDAETEDQMMRRRRRELFSGRLNSEESGR